MLRAAAAVLACLFLARCSPAESHGGVRTYTQNLHNTKDLSSVLASIEERLRVVDSISVMQAKQSRRLDVIQDKLDRVETTLSLRLERAQLAAERLEHRLHMLQTSMLTSVKESSDKLEKSQLKISELTQNLTSHIESHKRVLEKVNGAYADTWHRGLVMESMMRDGLSLVNATRRELADGLRALARRQRDARMTSADLEASFTRRINDNTYKIDLKMQEMMEAQKRLVDTCQREQRDDPTHVADVLDKLIDSLIDKTASTFHELQNIQVAMRNHDSKVTKLLTNGRTTQGDASCRRLESAFRNASHSTLKEHELQQLTEKFIALTNRADVALQRLEARINEDAEDDSASDVTSAADQLMLKLNGIKSETDETLDLEDGYFDDNGGDIVEENREILTGVRRGRQAPAHAPAPAPARPPHRRHLHKHPYDRGPRTKKPSA